MVYKLYVCFLFTDFFKYVTVEMFKYVWREKTF